MNATADAFTLPPSWVQALVDGTAGGIGFYNAAGTPFLVYAGRGSYGPAFTITAQWTR